MALEKNERKKSKIEAGLYKFPHGCETFECEYFIHWRPIKGEKVFFTFFAKNKTKLSVGLSTSKTKVSFHISLLYFFKSNISGVFLSTFPEK